MTGDAFTFVSPEEQSDLAAIEREIGKRLPRITVPGFDYAKAPAERFEVPIADRIAQIRARKAEDRRCWKEKAERRIAHETAQRMREQGRGAPPRGCAGPGPRTRRTRRTRKAALAPGSADGGRREPSRRSGGRP
jgi:ATP-dependent RNA helicase RhlE